MNGRIKRFRVDEQSLIGLFNLNTRLDQICVPVIESAPIDGVVVGAYHNWCSQCIEFIVSHPSFEYIENFQDVPYAVSNILGTVLLRKDKDVWTECNK